MGLCMLEVYYDISTFNLVLRLVFAAGGFINKGTIGDGAERSSERLPVVIRSTHPLVHCF